MSNKLKIIIGISLLSLLLVTGLSINAYGEGNKDTKNTSLGITSKMIDGAYGNNNADTAKNANFSNYVIYASIVIGTLILVSTIVQILSVIAIMKIAVNRLNESFDKLMDMNKTQLKDTLELFSDNTKLTTQNLSEKVQNLIIELARWQATDNKNSNQYSMLSKQITEISTTIKNKALTDAERQSQLMIAIESKNNKK